MAPFLLPVRLRLLFPISFILLFSGATSGDPGVFDSRILFGQSAAFAGPARALGLGMREGILAAFHEVNSRGGVKGRRLELISYDDGYEPDRAILNTNRLIKDDQVFALLGAVGTPTSKAAQPIATQAGVPFVGPFTGAEFLRNPYKVNVVNVRASYYQETEAMVERLTSDLNITRIAILYQDDSYGRAGLAGVEKALAKRGLPLVAEGTYMRNTTAVKSALLTIRKADPEAVILIGAYEPSAEFIKVARRIGVNPLFLNVSFVGSKALASALGEAGDGVIVTQVVPFPEDTSIPMVADYQRALREFNPVGEPGFVSLEGYMVGKLVVQMLSRIENSITREAFLSELATGSLDLGGIRLSYGPQDNQGMDQVFLTVIRPDGSFSPVSRLGD
ncbi:MAG: ABC transporter substrate-binding protein [Arenicellales bacterium]|nr:ABC transporter substrate-binding protein [Arenicellales bacterium]